MSFCGYQRGVSLSYLRDETLRAVQPALDEEQRAAVGIEQDTHVDEYPPGERRQVEVVRHVPHDLEEEVLLVDHVQFALQIAVLARVARQADLRLDQHAQHRARGRRQREALAHALQAHATLRQPRLLVAARRRLVRAEHAARLGAREILPQVFLRVGALVTARRPVALEAAREAAATAVRRRAAVHAHHDVRLWVDTL